MVKDKGYLLKGPIDFNSSLYYGHSCSLMLLKHNITNHKNIILQNVLRKIPAIRYECSSV